MVEDLISTAGKRNRRGKTPLREEGGKAWGVVSIFTYGILGGGLESAQEAGVKNVSSPTSTSSRRWRPTRPVSQEDIQRLIKFRDNPSGRKLIK